MEPMWTAVAPSWGEHAAEVDERGATATAALLDRARVGPGDRVLDVACGAGGLGLAAAERVGPDGAVVLSDFSPAMVEQAAARVGDRRNVTTRVLDLTDLDVPDGSFDAVVCREGLMFATDHERAVRELRRVLRAGGHAAVATWGPRGRNPWLGALLDAVSAHLGAPIPPPGMPGPFSLDDAGRLRELFELAGFEDVDVAELPVQVRAASVDEWYERTVALAGPLSLMLANLPAEARSQVREHAGRTVAAYMRADGALDLPGVTLLASGRASAP